MDDIVAVPVGAELSNLNGENEVHFSGRVIEFLKSIPRRPFVSLAIILVSFITIDQCLRFTKYHPYRYPGNIVKILLDHYGNVRTRICHVHLKTIFL